MGKPIRALGFWPGPLCLFCSFRGGKELQIDVLLKIAGVGLLVTAICQVLSRAGREDMATLATVAGVIIVMWMVVNLAGELLAQVQAVFQLP